LEAIGFEWKIGRRSDFHSRFKELIDYKQAHGHVNVPINNNKGNPHQGLGRWVASLRIWKKKEEEKARQGVVKEKKKRGGIFKALSAEQIKLLDSIGFDWTFMSKRSRNKSSLTNDDEGEEQVEFNEWENK